MRPGRRGRTPREAARRPPAPDGGRNRHRHGGRPPRGSARRRREAVIRRAFGLAAGVSIVISGLIIVALIGHAIDFLRQIRFSWLFADGWFARRNEFSIPTLAVGSLLVGGVAMLIAAPLGLGSAI